MNNCAAWLTFLEGWDENIETYGKISIAYYCTLLRLPSSCFPSYSGFHLPLRYLFHIQDLRLFKKRKDPEFGCIQTLHILLLTCFLPIRTFPVASVGPIRLQNHSLSVQESAGGRTLSSDIPRACWCPIGQEDWF